MKTFAIKRRVPGITMEQLSFAQEYAVKSSRQLTEEGIDVKYIQTQFFPKDSSYLCIFEAINEKAVKTLNEKLAIPFDEIIEMFDLSYDENMCLKTY